MNATSKDFLRTLQVMVVDDDSTFRRYLEVQLELLGCRIVPVESGDAAWSLIRAQPPDLVLTDVFMPGMSGVELCRRIKAAPELQGIPVVLLTMAGPRAKDEGYGAGADDFLNKPPHLVELRTRLHNLLLLRSLQTAAPAESAEGPGREGPPRRPRILMVESHGILRDFVRGVLAQEDWEFQGTAAVEQFLEALEAERPDLAIIDQDLMEGPGLSLVARLRNQAATSELPILLMCGPTALEPGAAAWPAADEHLVKPFEAAELRTRVRGLLKQAQLRSRQDAHHLDADPSSIKDPRTGAYTRPFLYASLDALCGFAALAARPVGLLAYQIPEAPRSSLTEVRRIAGMIRATLQPHEFLCRVEEDLFVAVMPGAEPRQVAAHAAALAPGAGRIATATGSGEAPAILLQRLWDQLRRDPIPLP